MVPAAANAVKSIIYKASIRCPSLLILYFFFKYLRPALELSFITNIIVLVQSLHR
jgi:hypothetical protein